MLVSRVAEKRGIRALTVKGPAAGHYGLRPPRVSADADVLIEPARFDEMLEALKEVGWAERHVSRLTDSLVLHSVTVISKQWPCDIDVHVMFPGFLKDAGEVFEELWQRREALEIAGQPVEITDRASSILIAGLHGLRSPSQVARHRDETLALAERIVPELSDADYRDLVALAAKLGAADTARPIFVNRNDGLPPSTGPGVDPALDEWRLRSASGGGRAGQIANAMRHAGWRDRLRLLREYIWRSPSEFALDEPDAQGSSSSISRARRARLGRGFRSVKNLIRGYRYMKAGKDDTALVNGENPW
nr:nucleotidyltransferase family protein [Demequina salsinemoris]